MAYSCAYSRNAIGIVEKNYKIGYTINICISLIWVGLLFHPTHLWATLSATAVVLGYNYYIQSIFIWYHMRKMNFLKQKSWYMVNKLLKFYFTLSTLIISNEKKLKTRKLSGQQFYIKKSSIVGIWDHCFCYHHPHTSHFTCKAT